MYTLRPGGIGGQVVGADAAGMHVVVFDASTVELAIEAAEQYAHKLRMYGQRITKIDIISAEETFSGPYLHVEKVDV